MTAGITLGVVYLAYRNYKGKSFIPISVNDVVDDFVKIKDTVIDTITDDRGIVENIKDRAKNLGDFINFGFDAGIKVVKSTADSVFTSALDTTTNLYEGLQKSTGELGKTLGDTIATTATIVKKVYTQAQKDAINARARATQAAKVLKEKTVYAAELAKKTLGDTYSNVQKIITPTRTATPAPTTSRTTTKKGTVRIMPVSIVPAVKKVYTTVKPAVNTAVKTVQKTFDTVYKALPTTAKTAITKATTLATTTISKAKTAASTAVSKVKNTLGGWFGW